MYENKQKEDIRFISLMRDLTFKTLWSKGSYLTKNYLNRIVSNIVGIDVSDFVLSTNELGLNNYKSIANKVDILLVNKAKRIKINIELNNKYSMYLIRKNDTYIYKLAGETYAGDENTEKYNYDINVMQINLNNFYNQENKNIPMNYYINADPINNLVKSGIKIYNLYLPKIKDMCYDGGEKLYDDLIMFKAENYEEMSSMIKEDKEREAVMEDLKRLGSDTEFVDLYDHDEFEKIMFEHEKNDAYELGKEQGIEQGLEKGIEQGQATIIKNLLDSDMSKTEISKLTKISLEEIERILES